MLIFISCKKDTTGISSINTNNIYGVWENSEVNPITSINVKWIPTNFHIGEKQKENIIRVRILDPIACTDSYPSIKNSYIEFSQYELNINVFFKTDSTAIFTVENEDSTLSFSFYKTDKEPFWGPCD